MRAVHNKRLGPSDSPSWEKKKHPDEDKIDSDKDKTDLDKDVEENVEEEGVETKDKDKVKEKQPKEKAKAPPAPTVTYYPSLTGVVVPICATDGETNPAPLLPVGAPVQCRVVANWFQQRIPLYACHVTMMASADSSEHTVSSSTPPCVRVKGTIIRVKINSTLGFDIAEMSLNAPLPLSVPSVPGVDGGGQSQGQGQDMLYYCDSRELRGDRDGSKMSSSGTQTQLQAHVGDIVEFLPVKQSDGLQIAVCPVVNKVCV